MFKLMMFGICAGRSRVTEETFAEFVCDLKLKCSFMKSNKKPLQNEIRKEFDLE